MTRLLAVHVTCEACGATSRLMSTEQVEEFFVSHFLPDIEQAEVLVDGRHRYVPVVVT